MPYAGIYQSAKLNNFLAAYLNIPIKIYFILRNTLVLKIESVSYFIRKCPYSAVVHRRTFTYIVICQVNCNPQADFLINSK